MILQSIPTHLLLCTALCFHAAADLSARELDALLQGYAFQPLLLRPRTGRVYDAAVPTDLTGVQVAALRLRSGSLRRYGVRRYKEFGIPVGVVEEPYVKRLVLVYHNLGNHSTAYYPLPGYTFLTPILGLLAYDASDLSARNLSELEVRASADRISVSFPGVGSGEPPPPKCVIFNLDGSVGFENVVDGNTCLTVTQGHFSIVVESPGSAPAPAPVAGENGTGANRAWAIAGSVVGGGVMLIVLSVVVVSVRQCSHRKKLRRMEIASEAGVALSMTAVGSTKAPVAAETRTRPLLENELVA